MNRRDREVGPTARRLSGFHASYLILDALAPIEFCRTQPGPKVTGGTFGAQLGLSVYGGSELV